jgi:uncharacterized protein
MLRPVHFEIPAEDAERAVRFYQGVFGWKFSEWEGSPQRYFVVETGTEQPGIDGGLIVRPTGPGAGTINTIEVPSVDEFVAKIEAAGGTVEVPKMPIPGVGWLAYCRDTEGNVFGVMNNDPSASM